MYYRLGCIGKSSVHFIKFSVVKFPQRYITASEKEQNWLLLTVCSVDPISLSHAMRPGLKIRHFWVAKSLFLSIICYQNIKDKNFRL